MTLEVVKAATPKPLIELGNGASIGELLLLISARARRRSSRALLAGLRRAFELTSTPADDVYATDDAEKPISGGLFEVRAADAPFVYLYKYHELKVILEGTILLKDTKTGVEITGQAGDVIKSAYWKARGGFGFDAVPKLTILLPIAAP